MKAAKYGNNPMKKNFPDLNKDGKVTRADVLMGRGVELNSPAKKYKSDAQRKAVHASKAERSPMRKTYKEAYKDADKSKYPTEASFIKEAKAYNMDKYGTTEPTRDSKKMGVDKSKLKAAIAAKSTMPAVQVKAKSKPKAKVNPDGTKRGSSSVVSKAGNKGTTGGNRKSSSVVGKSRSNASVVSSKASAEANKKKKAADKLANKKKKAADTLARQKENAAAQLARQKKRADRKASPAKNYKKGYYGVK